MERTDEVVLSLLIDSLNIEDKIKKYYKDDINRITNTLLENYNNTHNIRQIPIILGDIGESYVYDIITESGFKCDIISRLNYTCDLIIYTNYGNILVEVKNYSRTVPTQELTKFYRDLDMQKNIIGAIFISLNSPITGHGMLTFKNEWTENPLIIILASNQRDIISDTINLIINYSYNKNIMDMDMEFINKNLILLADHNNNLLKANKLIMDIKYDVMRGLDNTNKIIMESEMNIRRIIREIQGQFVYEEPVEQDIITKDIFFKSYVYGIASNNLYKEYMRIILDSVSESKMLIIKSLKTEVMILDYINIKFKMQKTKLTISIEIKDDISIPIISSYKDGWVSFEYTNKKIPVHETVKFINQLKEICSPADLNKS